MEVPSSITDKEIHNYLSEIKHQLAFTHSPKETASIMQMIESSIDDDSDAGYHACHEWSDTGGLLGRCLSDQ